ncbi:MAG: hypothetical protein HOI23_22975 [Deltaproteobacteria bacterium]|jgi:hypothetical protein|nr:hypothetical protein [Deltaproteobacteria bacterium]MBT6435740.1 hypothetical protein [Deltaproteobacteria bacterium]MBT6489668.1 hypothetical protein [Deltaproteobacteria bacterium]
MSSCSSVEITEFGIMMWGMIGLYGYMVLSRVRARSKVLVTSKPSESLEE